MARVGGRVNNNLARDCNMLSTKSVDFTEPNIANIPLEQGVGHPPVEVNYMLLLLPHEVMHKLCTKRGMDVKHASCVGSRVDQRLGDMCKTK